MDDEDRYIRITLRIPKDLHRSLSEAADQTSKSLNAEIVARLQGSFQGTGDRLGEQMDLFLMAVQNRSELLGLRADMIRNKLDTLRARMRAISAESELLIRNATTDADFDAAKSKAQEINGVEQESRALGDELEMIQKERHQLVAQMESIQSAATKKLAQIEPALAAYKARVGSARESKP